MPGDATSPPELLEDDPEPLELDPPDELLLDEPVPASFALGFPVGAPLELELLLPELEPSPGPPSPKTTQTPLAHVSPVLQVPFP
jgi:hypothetical protein